MSISPRSLDFSVRSSPCLLSHVVAVFLMLYTRHVPPHHNLSAQSGVASVEEHFNALSCILIHLVSPKYDEMLIFKSICLTTLYAR